MFFILVFAENSYTQSKEISNGKNTKLLIKYFGPKEYNASYSNWCIHQDKQGIMYFGNDKGVLEYDGNEWRLIKIPNNSVVRSLCADSAGRVYVAASSDFGYLSADPIGRLRFISLLKYLPEQSRNFGDVWDVVALSNTIYFKTQNKIFRWDGTKIKVFNSVRSYRLYQLYKNVYVRNSGKGLFKISGDSLVLVPDGQKFASMGIYDMLQYHDKILVTTNYQGLFLYDGKKFVQFKTEADNYFIKNRIYNACRFNADIYAFAMQRGGIVVINDAGKLLRIINKQGGLNTDIAYDVAFDSQGGLWAATGHGISRIEIFSPFTLFPVEKTGNDYISAFFRFDNTLYAANSFGLLYFSSKPAEFNLIPGINSGGHNFLSIGKSLFATTNNEVVSIDKEMKAKKILPFATPYFYKSSLDSNVIYLIDRNGLNILRNYNGKLKVMKNAVRIQSELVSLAEDNDGSLWIQTYYNGLIHVYNKSGYINSFQDSSEIAVDQYKNFNPPGRLLNFLPIDDMILFATDKGLFSFNKTSKIFEKSFKLGKAFADSSYKILFYSRDRHGDIWMLIKTLNSLKIGKAVKQNNGIYKWTPFPVFGRLSLEHVFAMYADYDGTLKKDFLWISTDEGLIRYDPSINVIPGKEFATFIREVIINHDSLIYAGASANYLKRGHIIPYKNNDIILRFTALSFEKADGNLYQYYLEGRDKEWSRWISVPAKEYINLPTGRYIFHVRSKNIYEKISNEDTFAFTILAPWYSSWWVYSIYGALFLAALFLIRYFELRRLSKKHKLALDLLAFEKLKELDRLKSHFFANISHEFRTPLTLILGQIESVLSSSAGTNEKAKLVVANKNARRLLILINQLLDLSKIEAGSMELKAGRHNIVTFLKSLFYSFESLAEAKKIGLKFEAESENIQVVFDPDKMEKVFYNLISNALKFTEEGGLIKIGINIIRDDSIKIKVEDNGIGISKDHLRHIFDRFYQADSYNRREYEGTGIGLALAKELVELHKGSIRADSIEGVATVFTISLPLADKMIDEQGTAEFSNDNFSFVSFNDDLDNAETNNKTGVSVPEKIGKEILLLVEDNADVRAYIREQTETNYKIVEACNGKEGIVKAEEIIPDLIITDVMMPVMDGYKFSKKIRENEKTSHIPIIMLTAKAGLDDKIEGLETGIDTYLTKPFSVKELNVCIKNLIIQRNNLRRRFSRATIIKPSEVSEISADQIFLQKIIKIIEEHYEDEKFSVEVLAEGAAMSVSQINRKLKALIDQPAGQLIRSLKLQRAADLLEQNTGTVAEICYRVGFNDQAYFSRSFKKQFGCSPSDYKKKLNAGKPDNH